MATLSFLQLDHGSLSFVELMVMATGASLSSDHVCSSFVEPWYIELCLFHGQGHSSFFELATIAARIFAYIKILDFVGFSLDLVGFELKKKKMLVAQRERESQY